ncbi:uncharacterized protein LOC125034989 [Penaeus chinensis]|uniref:uncharacterized protein LOC125034989 n=1 Tax=Penaeus chinensis TaxID=139456 RepID=UPI001FB7ED19|nr:uncharacterized protein LOC125034989 [Penaeus chinensis]
MRLKPDLPIGIGQGIVFRAEQRPVSLYFSLTQLTMTLLVSLQAQPSSQRKERDDSVDNYLKMVLENFAEAMKTGIPILGIPVLDPLNVGTVDIPSIEGPEFSLQANASQLLISGLSSFSPTAVHVDFQQASLTLGLHIVTVRIDGLYWADGLLLSVFPIFGNGPFYIQIVSTDISGLGDVTVTPDDYLQIEDLRLAATFDGLDVHFDNFLGGGSFGEIMSDVLSDLAERILAGILPQVQEKLVPSLVAYLNQELGKHTVGEIIDGILP